MKNADNTRRLDSTSLRPSRSSMRVRLLEADPDLGRWLPPEVSKQTGGVVLPALVLRTGSWIPPSHEDRLQLGFLVLDGLLAKDVTLGGTNTRQLFGPEDLVYPWPARTDEASVRRSASWQVLSQATLAVLGREFCRAAGRYPQLTLALLHRSQEQNWRQSTYSAICQLQGSDTRLLALLWHLAERWGRVTPGGVLLPLQLRHTTLGQMIGLKRSTITLALGRLADRGLLERKSGGWLLIGPCSLDAQTAGDARRAQRRMNPPVTGLSEATG